MGFPAILLKWITILYFHVVNAFFELVALFWTKRTVSPVEDPLLLQPGTVLASKVRSGQVKSETLIRSCIDRIKEVNGILNDVVREQFAQALEKAKEVDAAVANQRVPSDKPFFGVPFTMKDCIFLEGEICTAGIPCRRSAKAEYTADCAQWMIDAGAIPLAITNVSEVCMWYESVNTIYGRSRNPYDTRRIVGGSSGGEASLISSGGSVIGIGSDIGGSIRMPSFFNGVFGHKATELLCSDKGTYPAAYGYQKQMHTVGPICRYAADIYPMLKVLAGPNAHKLKPVVVVSRV